MPAKGEIRETFGVRTSSDHTSRCWMMLPQIAARASSRNGTATAATTRKTDVPGEIGQGKGIGGNLRGVGEQRLEQLLKLARR